MTEPQQGQRRKGAFSHSTWCYIRSLLTPQAMAQQTIQNNYQPEEYYTEEKDAPIRSSAIYDLSGPALSVPEDFKLTQENIVMVVRGITAQTDKTISPWMNQYKIGDHATFGRVEYEVQSVDSLSMTMAAMSAEVSGILYFRKTKRLLLACFLSEANVNDAVAVIDHAHAVLKVMGY